MWYEHISPVQWLCLALFALGKLCGLAAMGMVMSAAWGCPTRDAALVCLALYMTLVFACIACTLAHWVHKERKLGALRTLPPDPEYEEPELIV